MKAFDQNVEGIAGFKRPVKPSTPSTPFYKWGSRARQEKGLAKDTEHCVADLPGILTPSLLKVSCPFSLSVKWDNSTYLVGLGMGVKEIRPLTPPGQTLVLENSPPLLCWGTVEFSTVFGYWRLPLCLEVKQFLLSCLLSLLLPPE